MPPTSIRIRHDGRATPTRTASSFDGLTNLLANAPAIPSGARYLVCYSGGLDSSVLLHLASRSSLRPLEAWHVNHGLQPDAAAWELHCEEYCQTLGIPLRILSVRVDANDPSGPEAAARNARYASLRSEMTDGDVLVLAHHQQDQAETVLLRMLRGTGIEGLAGMRSLSEFASGQLWRPLLDISKELLRSYATRNNLRWIDDPQNHDPRYMRAWLRRQILPALDARQPGVVARLARLSQRGAEQAVLCRDLAQLDLADLLRGGTLDLVILSSMSIERQRNALRGWFCELGLDFPGISVLRRIQKEIIEASVDAVPVLRYQGREIRRYRSRLYIIPLLPPPPKQDFRIWWKDQTELRLPPGCGHLEADRQPPLPLIVRFAKPGERLRPTDAAHRQRLKKMFQQSGIPTWCRVRIPLVELGGEVAWLPGLPPTAEWRRFCAENYWYPRYHPAPKIGVQYIDDHGGKPSKGEVGHTDRCEPTADSVHFPKQRDASR